jgi:hypothetical protein
MQPTLTRFTALPKPTAPSRPPLTRREALLAGGAGVAAALLPGSVRG